RGEPKLIRRAPTTGSRASAETCHNDLVRHRGIVEGQGRIADYLTGFMAFSGNNKNIAAAQSRDYRRDGFAAIANLDGVRCRREDRAANLLGRLAARIVIRDIDEVGELAGDLAHFRPLAAVAG